jgi:hypothetical protein
MKAYNPNGGDIKLHPTHKTRQLSLERETPHVSTAPAPMHMRKMITPKCGSGLDEKPVKSPSSIY